MTRHKDLNCIHEPFGDAFYYGPERLSERFEKDQETRESSGFAGSTFKMVFDRLEKEGDKVRNSSIARSALTNHICYPVSS